MADHMIRSRIKRTTHGEQPTCAIEHRPSWRQSLSCDLNQVWSLRGSLRRRTKHCSSSRRTTDTRCNLRARSDLSPMFPAAHQS
jgi:hypothetical protein